MNSDQLKSIEREVFFNVVEEHPEGFDNTDYWKNIIRINEDGTRTLLSTATAQYKLIKNETLYKPLFKSIESLGGEFSKFFNEFRGARNWIEFTFPKQAFTLKLGDRDVNIKPKLTLKNSYDSTVNFGAELSIIANNFNIKGLKLDGVKIGGIVRHYGEIEAKLNDIGSNIINTLESFQETVKPFIMQLIDQEIKLDKLDDIITTICEKSMSLSKRKIELIKTMINTNVEELELETLSLFDVYGAISWHVDKFPKKESKDTNQQKLINSINRMIDSNK